MLSVVAFLFSSGFSVNSSGFSSSSDCVSSNAVMSGKYNSDSSIPFSGFSLT